MSAPRSRPTELVVALAVALAATAAGCFDDRGLAIEVNIGMTRATTVELFVGGSDCEHASSPQHIQCGGLTPPGEPTRIDGNVWFRDSPSRTTFTVQRGQATFKLQAASNTTVPIAIVVGSNANGVVGVATLRGLQILAQGSQIAGVMLTPASALPAATDQDRVVIWAPPNTSASSSSPVCIGVKHHDGTRTDFVVPADDPDCDGIKRDNECNPTAYLGTTEPMPGSALPSCVNDHFLAPGPCVLGNTGCDEAAHDSPTCVPQTEQRCVPASFCTACKDFNPGCTGPYVINTPDMTPRIECVIPMNTDIGSCASEAVVDLSTKYPSDGTCGTPKLLELSAKDTGSDPSFDGVKLAVSAVDKPCKLEVTWKGGSHPATDVASSGLVKLETPRGALYVPIVLRFVPAPCLTMPFGCALMGNPNDSMWTCTAP